VKTFTNGCSAREIPAGSCRLAACAPQNFVVTLPPGRETRESHLTKGTTMNFTKNIGMLLLAVYLILAGIMSIFHGILIPAIVMGILALLAGIFILIGK
jgi:hypothetical protein